MRSLFSCMSIVKPGMVSRPRPSGSPVPGSERPYEMTPAKLRFAQAAMGRRETGVGELCAELGVTRQTLYRHVDPEGRLRPDGEKLLRHRHAEGEWDRRRARPGWGPANGMPDLEQMVRRQRVLADFGEFALRCESLDEVLAEACRLVGEALGTERAKVLEIEHEGRTLLVRAGVGWKPGIVGRLRLPDGRALLRDLLDQSRQARHHPGHPRRRTGSRCPRS